MKGSVQRDETARQYATQCAEAQRCQLHERRGNPNSVDCRIAKDHAAMANYYNLDFTMNHLPAYFRNASYQLDYFAKYAFWPYMSNDAYKTGTPNEMKVQVYINPNFNTISVDVQKPFEATKFEGIMLPFNVLYGPHLLSIRKSAAKKLTDAVFGVDKTVCIVDKQVVKTFDDLAITRKPSSECWTLLTADASGAQAMAIMEKQIGGKPAVRILAGQSDVQISAGSGGFSVKVDGRPSPLSRQQPVVVSSSSGGQHATIAYIRQIADDYVKVHLPQHYVQLKVSQEGVQLYASPIVYRGKLTGVCGNMDGEHIDEMRAPQGCVFKSAEPFFRSFYVSEGGSSQQCKPHPPSSGQCVHLPQSAGTRY